MSTKQKYRGHLHSTLGAGWSGDQTEVAARFFAIAQIAPEYSGLGVALITHIDVKETVELYLHSPSGLSWPILGYNFTLYVQQEALCPVPRYQDPLHQIPDDQGGDCN
jgi:hypothetical protein